MKSVPPLRTARLKAGVEATGLEAVAEDAELTAAEAEEGDGRQPSVEDVTPRTPIHHPA